MMNTLRRHLRAGKVYRRADLLPYTNAPDRDLAALVGEGILTKLAQGVYYMPKSTDFGTPPPDIINLVKAFLKDDNFLIISPNMYNMLGFGTTQLYNERIVYNHKRHGQFEFGGLKFRFIRKTNFPKSITKEFLIVDFISNLKSLAEDETEIIQKLKLKFSDLNLEKVNKIALKYGSIKSKKIVSSFSKNNL